MRRRSDRARRDGFDQTRRQFERWRRGRARGGRIPEGLWKAAAGLAREHGVSKTALKLGLDYYGLKQRVAAAAKEPGGGEGRGGGFVEMPAWGLMPPPGCVVELEDRGGACLRIQLQGAARAEVLGPLVRALWSVAR